MENRSQKEAGPLFNHAAEEFDWARFTLDNLLLAFKHTALWEMQHPLDKSDPSTEGVAWGPILETVISEAADSLAAKTTTLTTAAMAAPGGMSGTERISGICKAMMTEAPKLQRLLPFLQIVADDDAEGRIEDPDWDAGFQILLDMAARLDALRRELEEAFEENLQAVTGPESGYAGDRQESIGPQRISRRVSL